MRQTAGSFLKSVSLPRATAAQGRSLSIAFAIFPQPLALMLELSSSGLNSNVANRIHLEYCDGGVPSTTARRQSRCRWQSTRAGLSSSTR